MAILQHEQIVNLFNTYNDVTSFIKSKNENKDKGMLIKQIQIPSSLTQSIAYYLIISNPSLIELDVIDDVNLKEGNNRTYDLIYTLNAMEFIKIEVKATGTSNFQRFRPHAITADFVIWLNFNGQMFDFVIFNPSCLADEKMKNNKSNDIDIRWEEIINKKYCKKHYTICTLSELINNNFSLK